MSVSAFSNSWALRTTVPAKKLLSNNNNGDLWGGNGNLSAVIEIIQVYGGDQIQLAYVGQHGSNVVSTQSGCPSSADYCCTNTQGQTTSFTMSKGVSTNQYNIFRVVGGPNSIFLNEISVDLGNYSYSVFVDETTRTATWPPSKRDIQDATNFSKRKFRPEISEGTSSLPRWKDFLATKPESDCPDEEGAVGCGWSYIPHTYPRHQAAESKITLDARDGAEIDSSYDDNTAQAYIQVRASPLTSSVYNQLKSGDLIAVPISTAVRPFIIPATALSGTLRGTPGYTKAAFASDMRGLCTLQSAQSFVYWQGNPANTDSFKQYITDSNQVGLTPYSLNLAQSSLNPSSAPNNWLFITSTLQVNSYVSLQIDSTEYTLVRVYVDPTITNEGSFVGSIDSGVSSAMSIVSSSSIAPASASTTATYNMFVDISNAGRTSGVVTLTPGKCCTSPIGPDGVVLTSATYGGQMSCAWLFTQPVSATIASGGVVRLMVSVPFVPYGLSGFCPFNITANGNPAYIYTEVDLHELPQTTTSPSSPTAPVASPTAACDPPYIKSSVAPYCSAPCKLDQTWVNSTAAEYISITPVYAPSSSSSSDPSISPANIVTLPAGGICVPVDCITKYKGSRNVYDPNTGSCKPYGSGTTPTPSSASPDLWTVTPTSTSPQSTAPTASPISGPSPVAPANCGAHGTWNPKTGMCDCDDGWMSAPGQLTQSANSYVYCSMVGSSGPKLIQAPSGSPVRNGALISITTVCSIAGVALLTFGIVMILRCCGCCCFKKKERIRDFERDGGRGRRRGHGNNGNYSESNDSTSSSSSNVSTNGNANGTSDRRSSKRKDGDRNGGGNQVELKPITAEPPKAGTDADAGVPAASTATSSSSSKTSSSGASSSEVS